MKTLILIDIQNDFLPGGRLAVPAGDEIIPVVNGIQDRFELVVATQDWHPQNHTSFASNHPGRKEFDVIELNGFSQKLWPDHCVQGSSGAAFPSSLSTDRAEAIIRKGVDPAIDSYSGFFDNHHQRTTGLADYLRGRGTTSIYLTGLAGDICAFFTGMDGLEQNFEVFMIEDAVRPLSDEEFKITKQNFTQKGGRMIRSADIPKQGF